MVEILIKNGTIVTMDGKRRIIKEGAVLIDQSRIIDVGKTKDLVNKYKAEKEFDATSEIVLPGLVNTHTHLYQVLNKGLGDDLSLEEWMERIIFPLGINTTEDEFYSGAMLALVDMIKSGTTCFLDNHFIHTSRKTVYRIAEAVKKTGLRGVLAPCFADRKYPESTRFSPEEAVKEYIRLIKSWHNKAHGRIQVWLFSGVPGVTTSQELMREIRRISDKYGIGISAHVAEDLEYFYKTIKKDYGFRGHVDFIHHTGLLGPKTLLAHCIWISDKEIKTLKATDTKVAHNPVSNMYLRAGIAPVHRLMRAGVTVSLGTDGAASTTNLDMFEVMRQAILLHRVREFDSAAVTTRNALEMSTINGARALGLDKEIGSIERGKRADIILIDFKKPHMVPTNKVSSNLVYCANGSDVETVIVDGKIIMENRVIETVNEDDVMKAAEESARKILERSDMSHLTEESWPIE